MNIKTTLYLDLKQKQSSSWVLVETVVAGISSKNFDSIRYYSTDVENY